MPAYETISVTTQGTTSTLTLNRPHVHNAMDITMIRELSQVIDQLREAGDVTVVNLCAEGKNFSAGADINWMREGLEQSSEQLEAESMELAYLFHAIANSPMIFVASVQGKAMGGANGLVAAADIVIAANNASFAFSEVKLGLVPATIAPYVVKKIGYSRSLELMISGRPFSAQEAREINLVHLLCEETDLGTLTQRYLSDLKRNGPKAMSGVKTLLAEVQKEEDSRRLQELTAKLIAHYRTSVEGQEGMQAFFDKRDPEWYEKS